MSRGIFSCHNHREGPLLVSSGQESRILISTLQRPGPHKKKKKKYEAQRSVSWGSLPSAIGSWTADWNVQTAMKCLFEETAFKTFREGYSGAWLMYSSESMLLPLFPFAWNVKGHYKKTGHSVYQKVFSLIFFFLNFYSLYPLLETTAAMNYTSSPTGFMRSSKCDVFPISRVCPFSKLTSSSALWPDGYCSFRCCYYTQKHLKGDERAHLSVALS